MTIFLGWLFLLSVFNGAVFNIVPLPSFCGLWDESATILLALMCVFNGKKKNKGRFSINCDFRFIVPWFIIIITGLIANLIWNYAGAWQAIIRDIVGFIKFPLCFTAIRFLGLDKKIRCFLDRYGFKVLEATITVIFVLGVISVFKDIGLSQSDEVRHGIYSYQFLFNHPNSLGLAEVLLLCLIDSEDNQRNSIYVIMCLGTLILTMRTKILAFVAIFIYAKCGARWSKKYKVLFWITAISLVMGVSYGKLSVVTKWTESGRMSFWAGSVKLAAKCFPLGSGFGTFASHISGKYVSKIYSFMHIKEIFDAQGNPTAVLGDTGYPYYIAQFGVVGIILLTISIKNLLKMVRPQKQMNWSAILLLIYLCIALTGESTLLNAGVEFAVTLAVILAKNEKKILGERVNKI